VAVLEPDPERIRREFAQGPATYARLFELFLVHYAERRGKPRWGVQTGLIERYADHLFAAYPGVKVIQMIRDPRDRYEASLALWPKGKGRAGGATARWRYSTRLAERNLRRYPGDYAVVRYEDLVLRTEETLREVCRFLGETFRPEMLEMPGAPDRGDKLLARSSPSSTGGLLSGEHIGRFRGRVPRRELAFMQLHSGKAMRRYGYVPDPLDLDPREWMAFAAVEWPGQLARMVAWRAVEAVGLRFPRSAGRRPDPKTSVGASVEVAR
jgi:hypothetical protein